MGAEFANPTHADDTVLLGRELPLLAEYPHDGAGYPRGGDHAIDDGHPNDFNPGQ